MRILLRVVLGTIAVWVALALMCLIVLGIVAFEMTHPAWFVATVFGALTMIIAGLVYLAFGDE
jgi:hypothetical protein